MLISDGSNRCSAEPVLRANRRNREPMSSGSPLRSRSLPLPLSASRSSSATRASEPGGAFLSPGGDERRARDRGRMDRSWRSTREERFRRGNRNLRAPPTYPRRTPEGRSRSNINFAATTFRHPPGYACCYSVTHMEMEIGHRNPVCQRKHPLGREAARPSWTGFHAAERRKVESFSLLRIILLSDIGIAGIRRRDTPGEILFRCPLGFPAHQTLSPPCLLPLSPRVAIGQTNLSH